MAEGRKRKRKKVQKDNKRKFIVLKFSFQKKKYNVSFKLLSGLRPDFQMDYLFYSNMSQVFFLKVLFLKLLLKLISEKQCEICQQSAEILLFFFFGKSWVFSL